MAAKTNIKVITLIIGLFALVMPVQGQDVPLTKAQDDSELKVIETKSEVDIQIPAPRPQPPSAAKAVPAAETKDLSPVRYTLGPDDVIEITVMRHPEFSGIFPVNLEGKIQFKFAGDIEVTGLTKKEVAEKITGVISAYVINPDVNVTITEYKSKIIYVLGEVGAPGKYYMRSDTINVREAAVVAGLPTLSAAMRRCRLITPDTTGKAKIQNVDLYAILYGGDLRSNPDMKPGDVLYVPATVMAKVIRVINPVTSAVGVSTTPAENVSSAKSAFTTGMK